MARSIDKTDKQAGRGSLEERISRREALARLVKMAYAAPTLTVLSLPAHAQLPSPCGDPGPCPDQNPFLPPDED